MSFDYLRTELTIPEELPDLLRGFSVECLRAGATSRADLLRLGVTWFRTQADARRASPVHTMTENAFLNLVSGALAAEDPAGTGTVRPGQLQRVVEAPSLALTSLQKLVIYSYFFEDEEGLISYTAALPAATADLYARGTAGAVPAPAPAPPLLHGQANDDFAAAFTSALQSVELPCSRADLAAVFDDSELGLTVSERNILLATVPAHAEPELAGARLADIPVKELLAVLNVVANEKIGPDHAHSTSPPVIAAAVQSVIASSVEGGFIPLANIKAAFLGADFGLTTVQACSLVALIAGGAGGLTPAAVLDIAPSFIRRLRMPQRLAVLADVPIPATVFSRTPGEVAAMIAAALADHVGDAARIHASAAQRVLTGARLEPDEAAAVVAACVTDGPDVDPEDLSVYAFDTLALHIREKIVQERLQ